MAEALLRATLVKRGQGLEKLKVASFGLAAEGGQPPSANSVKAMQRIGLDVSDHRSRLLTQADVDRSVQDVLATLARAMKSADSHTGPTRSTTRRGASSGGAT